MRRLLEVFAFTALISLVVCPPAAAAGPIDGEVGAVYWASEFEASEGASSVDGDSGAPGLRAQLWFFERYGVRAEHHSSEPDDFGGETTEYTSLDVMWKAFSLKKDTFFAVGAGWQTMDLSTLGLDGDTSGLRLSAEGRFGILGPLNAYGEAAYLPSLDDASSVDPATLGSFEDLTGWEYEFGVNYKFTPFVSLRAAYRANQVDYTRTGSTFVTSGSSSSIFSSGDPSGDWIDFNEHPGGESERPTSRAFVLPATNGDGTADSSGVVLGLTIHF